jgi:subtilisin family serine protease
MMRRPQVFKRLVTLAILFSLSSAFLISSEKRVSAKPKPTVNTVRKISPDLRKVMETNGGSTVRVIVQSTASSSVGLIGGLLQLVGGVVVKLLSTLNIQIAEVRAYSVEALAADPSVTYISLDNTVQTTGHIVTTSGAQQVRAQKSGFTSYTLDGTDANIAIVDSGIDATHKSFSSSAGKIMVSKDFTDALGEGSAAMK